MNTQRSGVRWSQLAVYTIVAAVVLLAFSPVLTRRDAPHRAGTLADALKK
jgi:hypothetical protein